MVETDSTNTDKNEAVEAASVVVIKKERGRPKKNLIIILLLSDPHRHVGVSARHNDHPNALGQGNYIFPPLTHT
jgi:hypothetical protein